MGTPGGGGAREGVCSCVCLYMHLLCVGGLPQAGVSHIMDVFRICRGVVFQMCAS
jgi:hypothetical protein